MLVDMITGRRITDVPYKTDYRLYMSRLTKQEIADIKAALNAQIDGTEIQTSSWMPGSDWTGTEQWKQEGVTHRKRTCVVDHTLMGGRQGTPVGGERLTVLTTTAWRPT